MKKYIYLLLVILVIESLISGCIWQINKTDQFIKPTIKITESPKSTYQQIKFLTVGDLHVKVSNITPTRGNERLEKIVKFINKSDVDFVVFLGDLGDAGTANEYKIIKSILKNLNKPYYTVIGNHDLKYCTPHSDDSLAKGCAKNQAMMYEKYFGPQIHLEDFKGYQLIFPGIRVHYRYENGKYIEDHFDWLFNFNESIDRTKPTIVFMHGAIRPSPPDSCSDWKPGFTEYGVTMIPYLEQFTDLIASYNGHVHIDTEQTFDTGKSKAVEYITNGALVDTKGAGGDNCEAIATNYIGYSTVKDGKLEYKLVSYNN